MLVNMLDNVKFSVTLKFSFVKIIIHRLISAMYIVFAKHLL